MKSTLSHLSSFTIDALALGALATQELEAARAHLQGCARCRDDSAAAGDLAPVFGPVPRVPTSHAAFA